MNKGALQAACSPAPYWMHRPHTLQSPGSVGRPPAPQCQMVGAASQVWSAPGQDGAEVGECLAAVAVKALQAVDDSGVAILGGRHHGRGIHGELQ